MDPGNRRWIGDWCLLTALFITSAQGANHHSQWAIILEEVITKMGLDQPLTSEDSKP
jgi:hypothetical protein